MEGVIGRRRMWRMGLEIDSLGDVMIKLDTPLKVSDCHFEPYASCPTQISFADKQWKLRAQEASSHPVEPTASSQ
jgi:hypothetical protein